MHIKFFISITCLFLAMACNSSKERPILKAPVTERVAPPADDWDAFWQTFTRALDKHAVGQVTEMTRWPLFTNMGKESFSDQHLKESFDDIFDEKTRNTFKSLTDRDIQLIPSNEETARFMNTPLGIVLKSINVNYLTDQGTGQQAGSTKTFIFGEIDGHYKWLALVYAG